MDLGIFTVPLMTLLIAFGFAVATDTRTVLFEDIEVPQNVAMDTGYSSPVIIARLADEMARIEEDARSGAVGRQVELNLDAAPTVVLGEYLGVKPLVRVVQHAAHLVPFTFRGDIVQHNGSLIFTLRGVDSHDHSILIVRTDEEGAWERVIKAAAFEVMRVINPYILAAYQFKRDRMIHDFSLTRDIIHHYADNEGDIYRKWMVNLEGMVLYQEGERYAAVERFKDAATLDPEFLTPVLNIGVVLARLGLQDEAIARYRAVTESKVASANPTTVAAAYAEWGFSLALQGNFDEAYSMFERATKVDPSSGDVFVNWAEVLSVQGLKVEAAGMRQRALQLERQEIIHTENLIGDVQIVPATAHRR